MGDLQRIGSAQACAAAMAKSLHAFNPGFHSVGGVQNTLQYTDFNHREPHRLVDRKVS
jgi:hypothetical protein